MLSIDHLKSNISTLTTNNLSGNNDTEFICLFCYQTTKLRDFSYVTDNCTLICPNCNIDCLVKNQYDLNQIKEFSLEYFEITNEEKLNYKICVKKLRIEEEDDDCYTVTLEKVTEEGGYPLTTYWGKKIKKLVFVASTPNNIVLQPEPEIQIENSGFRINF